MNTRDQLSSPNHMVWNYSFALRRAVWRVAEEEDETTQRQEAAVVIFMAVTVVEAFLNAYFRVLVSEAQFREHETGILRDLDRRLPLANKICEWPKRLFGQPFDENLGVGRDFAELRALRNRLMHFQSSHETSAYENVVIHGLADTTDYASLTAESSRWAQQVAEGTIEEMFRLQGFSAEQRAAAMHLWVARPP